MVAQLKELAELVGSQRDVRMKVNNDFTSASKGRGSRQHLTAFADAELREATDIVAKAADTISEMARRNQELEAAASRAVLHYKAEAEAAAKKNAELNEQIDALQQQFHAQVGDFQRRVDDLQSRLAETIASLDAKTQDSEFANEWLAYLSAEIRKHLSDAPKKLSDTARDVRARRFEFQNS